MTKKLVIKNEVKKSERWLPCILTADELLERGRTLSEMIKEKAEIEAEKARVVRSFGERLKEANGEIARLSQTVRNRSESRRVQCEETWLYSQKVVSVVRTDTGEEIERRPIMDRELQTTMDDVVDQDFEEIPEGGVAQTSEI